VKTLFLYSRPGCHLCEELAERLMPLVAGRAAVRHVDISQDVALERRYGRRIPVLTCTEGELSGFPLDEERVARYLDAAGTP
jgi:hypothetical protein